MVDDTVRLIRIRSPWEAALVALTCGYFLFSLINVIAIPVFGWDVLNYWAPRAVYIFLGNKDFVDEVGTRHPPVVPSILAFSLWLKKFVGIWSKLIYLAIFLMTMAAVAASDTLLSVRKFVAFTTLMCFSLPLFENHLIITGYSELVLSCASVFFLFVVTLIAFKRFSYLKIPLILLAGTLVAGARNTGWAILVLDLVSITLFLALRMRVKFSSVLSLAVFLFFCFFAITFTFTKPYEIKSNPYFSVNQSGENISLRLRDCARIDSTEKVVLRPMDQKRNDLKGDDGRPSNIQVISFAGLENSCFHTFENLAAGASLVAIEVYKNDGSLEFWSDFFVDTRVLKVGDSIELGFGKVSWIKMFGWRMNILNHGFGDALSSFFYAHFFNSSFSLIFLVGVFFTVYIFRSGTIDSAIEYIFLIKYWLLLLVYFFAQVFVDRFHDLAIPSNDTYGSRFVLTASLSLVVLGGYLFSCKRGVNRS